MIVPDITKQLITLQDQKYFLQRLENELLQAEITCKQKIQELHDAHMPDEIVDMIEKEYYDSICQPIDFIVDKIKQDCIPNISKIIDGFHIDRYPQNL